MKPQLSPAVSRWVEKVISGGQTGADRGGLEAIQQQVVEILTEALQDG